MESELDVVDSQFQVNFTTGFLPIEPPLAILPEKYQAIENLLEEMPLIKKNGEPGLLALEKMSEGVKALPMFDFSSESDTRLLTALFRDYCYAASAFIFEPCHHSYQKFGRYGEARSKLPSNLAIPLTWHANRLSVSPFLDYAHSYCLYNWKTKDGNEGLEFSNLECIRSFTGGSSEFGFILVHVAMNRYSGDLVKNALDFLKSAEDKDNATCVKTQTKLLATMQLINKEMKTMWQNCMHTDYCLLRTFILGIKDQPVLPNGLIYEGVSAEPKFYRGETGANDSIIPLMDNLLEITAKMPKNKLTEILKEFRGYRPKNHNNFLILVQERSTKAQTSEYLMQTNPIGYLQLLDQVREFRATHWSFAKIYILKYSNYPVATGGSPIVTWLPNQLTTVLREMENTIHKLQNHLLLEGNKKLFCEEMLTTVRNQLSGVV